MKEVKRYKCDHCDREFDTAEECTACENSHFIPVKILKYKYNGFIKMPEVAEICFGIKDVQYPDSITVKMSDGSKQTYYRRV